MLERRCSMGGIGVCCQRTVSVDAPRAVSPTASAIPMPQTIPKQPLGRLILRILDFIFVLVLLLVGFLSLRSSGYLTELWWFPRGVAEWSDSSRHLPHTLAFFVLALVGFCAGLPLRWMRQGVPVLWSLVSNGVLFLTLAVVLEAPQLWLVERTFTVLDILAGWAGVGLALGVYLGGRVGFVRFSGFIGGRHDFETRSR